MSKPEKVVYKSETEVLLTIRDHFNPKEYITLPQVRNAAGFDAKRTADCLVISTWPSRGLGLFGIEIKVSRADWLREREDPSKADAFARYCDFWVVAVGDEQIVKDGELPVSWGLLVPGSKPNSLRMKVHPKLQTAEPMPRTLLATVLSKASATIAPFADIEKEITRRALKEAAEREEKLRKTLQREYDVNYLNETITKLKAAAQAFYEVTGCYLDPKNKESYRQLGEAYKLLQWNGLSDWLAGASRTVGNLHQNLNQLHASLPAEFRNNNTDQAA